MIPFVKPTLGKEEDEAILKVLHSGWLAAGPETQAFEKEFAEYVGAKYAIFTNSCTSALKMAYKYLKEKKYGFITYPYNTFCATYSAAKEIGLNTAAYRADEWLPRNNRVNVHYGSVKDETPCLIEDSAHRIEANDPLVGRIRCYSFYVTKNMTTGSGGMLVTNDKQIYDRCRLFWRDGLTSSTQQRNRGGRGHNFYQVVALAGGYDGNDLAAALGRVQLHKLPAFTQRRNDIRDHYNAAFGQNWAGNHLYPYFVGDELEVARLYHYLERKGIGVSYHYPNTGWLGVSLPIYPLLTDNEVQFIIETIRRYPKR